MRMRGLILQLVIVALVLSVVPVRAQEPPGAPAQQPPPVAPQGVATGNDAWSWRNPVPQGNDIVDLAFVDPNVGWGVGREGLVMKTTDGGLNWSIQATNTTRDLTAIAALSADTAFIVGTGGTMLATDDGGQSWRTMPAGVAEDLAHVQFVDRSTLWSAGRRGTLRFSVNAGATWETTADGTSDWDATVPLTNAVDIARVRFLNRLDGCVLTTAQEATTLYCTGDGGVTWRQRGQPFPGVARDIAFGRDLQTAVAAGDRGLMLRTTDGGATWQRLNIPTAANLTSVTFSDDETAHAVGDGGVVLKSVSGGRSWAVLPPPRPSTLRLTHITFVNPTVGYSVGAAGTLLKTVDAGASWQPLSLGSRGTLRSVSFLTDEIGVAVGERGTIVKTADRGDTWRPIPSGTRRDLNSVRFLNRQTGFAVGDGGVILRSDDSGESWRPIESPVGMNLRGIGLSGNPLSGALTVGLIVGDTNLVLRSADGGNTWTQIPLPGPQDALYTANFPEPRIGYIGGSRTTWQSTDFGNTWRLMGATRRLTDPLAFAFPSINRGYAVGLSGQIYRTTDGGTTWTQQNSGSRANLRGVFFLDDDNGYVVGDTGTVLVTNNAGETWTVVDAGTHLNLWDVQFLNGAVGVAVGQGGVILKSTSGGLPTRDTPPAVVAVVPKHEATQVSVDDAVRITFSKQITFSPEDYGPEAHFRVTDPAGAVVPATLAYLPSDRQVIVRPLDSLTPGLLYTVTIVGGSRGLADLQGQRMVFDYRTQFRTTCPVRVAGGFGRLNAIDPSVRHKIGCPEEEERLISATEQVFERGHMLSLGNLPDVVVSFFSDRRWTQVKDTSTASQGAPTLSPPEGLFAPQGRFGQIWRSEPGIRDRLGWAIGRARPFRGVVQRFAGGTMVWTGDEQWLIRIYYNDGATITFPDPNQPAATPDLQIESPGGRSSGHVFAAALAPTPLLAAQDLGEVLFAEEFEDPNVTLMPEASPNASRFVLGYSEGEYILRRTESALAGTTEVPVPGEYGNAAIAVEVRIVGTAAPPRYVRLTCRGRPGEESEYRLLVQPGNRQFRLERRDRGIPVPLVDWRASNAVRANNERNQLELACVGDMISATINGELVASVRDATYASGRVEIGVFAPSQGLDARFDNLYVYRREAASPPAGGTP
jgi:photosystem II stability/assembly factor-like uncharacterized protein